MKTRQLDLEQAIKNKNEPNEKPNNAKPVFHSAYYPHRLDVPYVDDQPSLTRQEFSAECDINIIMKNYEATGILPNYPGREPIYWDSESIPSNLQDAMGALNYANELFMQLGAPIRKEFDNDPVKFVQFAQDPANTAQLKTWGLTAPETAPSAPVRVEVVAPPPTPSAPTGEPPPAE